MSAATLDHVRFKKIRALHDGTNQPGERAAAAGRMAVLAEAAGMTVVEAITTVDAKPDPWKVFVSEREAKAAAAAASVRARYGSEEKLFADTPLEAALRAAFANLPKIGRAWLWTWDGVGFTTDMPPCVRKAVDRPFFPLPSNEASAWAEYIAVDQLNRDRSAVDPTYYGIPLVYARQAILEQALNSMASRSLNDVRARLDWLIKCDEDFVNSRAALTTLRADIERMAARIPRRPAA